MTACPSRTADRPKAVASGEIQQLRAKIARSVAPTPGIAAAQIRAFQVEEGEETPTPAPQLPRARPTPPTIDGVPFGVAVNDFRDLTATVYDIDGRYDLRADDSPPVDPRLAAIARGVPLLVSSDLIIRVPPSSWRLKTRELASTRSLCIGERFRKQPIVGTSPPDIQQVVCSAFLVGPRLVATARHCVRKARGRRLWAVFGYEVLRDGTVRTLLAETDVYSTQPVVQGSGSADYALLRLDRDVPDRERLNLSPSAVATGARLLAVGYPDGLPQKFAPGARARPGGTEYFRANLDTYGGSSGSPVLNELTGAVEGMLIRGGPDLQQTPSGCYISFVCPRISDTDIDCEGEHCLYIAAVTNAVRSYIPAN